MAIADPKMGRQLDREAGRSWHAEQSACHRAVHGPHSFVERHGLSRTVPLRPLRMVEATCAGTTRPPDARDRQLLGDGSTMRTDSQGISWAAGAPARVPVPLDTLYVASPAAHNAAMLNAALAQGARAMRTIAVEVAHREGSGRSPFESATIDSNDRSKTTGCDDWVRTTSVG